MMTTYLPVFFRRYSFRYSMTLLLAVSIMLLGCSKTDNTELRIKHHFNALELKRNFKLTRKVQDLHSGAHGETLRQESAEVLRVAALHQPYLKDKSKSNLLVFADSMSGILTRLHFKNDSINDELKTVRGKVATSDDSLDVLNLFFWAITAENMVMENHLSQITVFEDHFTMILPSFLEKKSYVVGDTVRVAFQTFPEYGLSFDQVKCINQNTKQDLSHRILKVGPSYILSFLPKESGIYVIDGMVGVGGDFTNGMLVSNEFTVE
jgi:hypothetical protein